MLAQQHHALPGVRRQMLHARHARPDSQKRPCTVNGQGKPGPCDRIDGFLACTAEARGQKRQRVGNHGDGHQQQMKNGTDESHGVESISLLK
ncbi:hypothetical protein D3C81_2165200 [compost metagenome]